THSDDGIVADGCAMDDRAMAHRHIRAQGQGNAGVGMQHAKILDIGVLADADPVIVTAQHASEPHACPSCEPHPPDEDRVRRKPILPFGRQFRAPAVERVKWHAGLHVVSSIRHRRCTWRQDKSVILSAPQDFHARGVHNKPCDKFFARRIPGNPLRFDSAFESQGWGWPWPGVPCVTKCGIEAISKAQTSTPYIRRGSTGPRWKATSGIANTQTTGGHSARSSRPFSTRSGNARLSWLSVPPGRARLTLPSPR